MKKLLLFGLSVGFFLTGKAQMVSESAVIIDAAEDTTQISTINDIVVMQERVSSRNITDAHVANVWSRKSYFNPGFVFSTLSSKDPVALNPNVNEKLSFKSAWGAQIQLGHRYTLHRGAIANMVQINLDYTYIDLTGNGYDEDENVIKYFHPDYSTGQHNQYEAWGSKKYTATYGMSLGPSVTVAPFTMLNSKGLHFIKINGYFHVGYNIGGLIYTHKYDFDKDTKGELKEFKGTQTDIMWGHGLSTAFGLSLSWKSIGIGWETRNTNIDYETTHPSRYGKGFKTPLKNSTSRIYLNINY